VTKRTPPAPAPTSADPSSPDTNGAPRDDRPSLEAAGDRRRTTRGDSRRLLVGVGNPDRGDDAAGRAVARRLRSRSDGRLEVRECAGEATALLEAWAGFDDVVLVDACRGAGPPGSVHRISPDELERVATLRHASTHSLGVVAAIGLARAFGGLPAHLVIYAIEAGRSRESEALSPEVRDAVGEVAALILQDSQTRAHGC
jgi:hydrogenase maturation protease